MLLSFEVNCKLFEHTNYTSCLLSLSALLPKDKLAHPKILQFLFTEKLPLTAIFSEAVCIFCFVLTFSVGCYFGFC